MHDLGRRARSRSPTPQCHPAACREPDQRRHCPGDLRPGRHNHRRRGAVQRAARLLAVSARLRRRGTGRSGTAWLTLQVRRRLDDPLLENVASLVTPFTAFLFAEVIGASGVLAVVVCGLVLSQVNPRVARADTRQQGQAFWSLSTFVLDGALFILVGLEVNVAVRSLSEVFAVTYLIRLLDRRPQQRLRRVSNRARVLS